MAQPTLQQAFAQAMQHHQAGRLREAEQNGAANLVWPHCAPSPLARADEAIE